MAGSGTAALRRRDDVLLTVEHLVVEFPVGRGARVRAVSDVTFDVARGETLGLVGESGCGKSTTARAIMHAPRPTSGRVVFDGRDLGRLGNEELRRVRPEMQMIFQDPISSLNPRRRIVDIVREGLDIWGRTEGADRRVAEILRDEGIDRDGRPAPSHQFSGGSPEDLVARALVLDRAVICDEPVSALDVSVQAQILNLLEDMKERYHLTMVFIAHDLAVVKNVSDRVAVMYLGKICEVASPDDLYANPAHPYTAALLESIPEPDPTAHGAEPPWGASSPPRVPPSGCRFRTRCPRAEAVRPGSRSCAAAGRRGRPRRQHVVACHFPLVPAAEPAGGGAEPVDTAAP